MPQKRTEVQQEVIDALLESNAINFDAVGSILTKYGARAARTGSDVAVIVGWRAWDICIPPEPYGKVAGNIGQEVQG